MRLEALNWSRRPWQEIPPASLGEALNVPTMLSMDEALLYYWLAAQSDGFGAVIDLGTHRGGSAARLLAGLAASGSGAPLYSYGRFGADDDKDDLLAQVRSALAPWGAQTTLVKGDIALQRWSGQPVEILAIDAAKTATTADRIAEEFFPALEPGRSVLIQQDFLHSRQPWLSAQMAALANCVSLVAVVGEMCGVFVLTAPITRAHVALARTAGLDDAALIAGVAAAEAAFSPLVPRRFFRSQRDRILANPGVRKAWRMNP